MDSDRVAPDRRTFLATVGTGLLAGCVESREDNATPPQQTAADGTADGTPTERTTDTPTETEDTPRPRPLDGTWPSYGYDLGNSGFNPATMPLTGTTLQWSHDIIGNNTLRAPVLSEDVVVIPSEGSVYALNRVDGALRWRVDLGIPTYNLTPAVDGGVVYAAARGLAGVSGGSDTPGVLVAIDAATGRTQWRREAFASSSLTVSDGSLYHAAATADRGYVRAVAADGSAVRWTYAFAGPQTGSSSFGTPALGSGLLFATGTRHTGSGPAGRLVALDPATGERQWRVTAPDRAEKAPVYSDGDVFFSSEDGTLFGVDATTGSVNWTRRFEVPPITKPSVGNGLVYVLSNDRLHALDRSDGVRRWKREVGPVQSGILITPDAVIVGGTKMDGFDATTGERRFQHTISGAHGAFGGPVVVDGYMYVGACVKQNEQSVYDDAMYLLG